MNHFGKYLGVNLEDSFLSIFFDELKSCVSLDNIKLKETITKLSRKYDLVLLTNYFKESQLNRLNTMGIGNLFSDCYGEELIKPNKDIYIKACGEYQPEECVLIGDDLYLDIEVPQSLGINTIFVNTKNLNDIDIKVPTVDRVEDITLDLIEKITINKN